MLASTKLQVEGSVEEPSSQKPKNFRYSIKFRATTSISTFPKQILDTFKTDYNLNLQTQIDSNSIRNQTNLDKTFPKKLLLINDSLETPSHLKHPKLALTPSKTPLASG
jgi:hypothetical protein